MTLRKVVPVLFHREFGATLVETVIVLPLFLFGILAFIWIGVSLNERAAFESGVGNALRLGATRGNEGIVHEKILPGVNAWKAAPYSAPDPKIQELLIYPYAAGDWSSKGEPYYGTGADDTGTVGGAFEPKKPLYLLPAQYTYVLVYIFQSLRQSIGNSIRYPCDPNQPDGAGCVLCTFADPVSGYYPPNTPNRDPPPTEVIAIQCEYRPARFLLAPLYGMLSFLGPSGGGAPYRILRVRKRFPISSGEID